MRLTVKDAARHAAVTGKRDLDRPTKQFGLEEHNKGWIRAVWPSKNDVKRNFKRSSGASAEAKVFVIPPLVEELHSVVYGGRQDNIPERSRGVITPTEALMKGLSGRGRLKKLNAFGNIAGFKNGVLKRLKDNDEEYLNVPLNNTDPATKHLPPGLYFKGREIVNERSANRRVNKQLTRQRAKLSSRQRAQGKRVRSYLVMLLAYDRVRYTQSKWRFDKEVRRSYDKNYARHFRRELIHAISTAK